MSINVERFLVVAGKPNAGKSKLLREMLRRLFSVPIAGTAPLSNKGVFKLSKDRRLLVLLSSPQEDRSQSEKDFLDNIEQYLDYRYKWSVAVASQIEGRETIKKSMPAVQGIVEAIEARFNPGRIRVALLSPDWKGRILSQDLEMELESTGSCQIIYIDPHDPQAASKLAETFDFSN